MIYLESKSSNPYFNLATEEYIFNQIDEDVFMLWQNDNTIVLGKYQNTVEEISAKFVRENDIRVVRRLSGGGAVYHDIGNINFTFISRQAESGLFEFTHFTRHIVEILNRFGVKAEFNSRNDLVIGGRKFSGNSQYAKKGKVLHHGTILFDSNLETLVHALNVSEAKIESKAIKSVHERVTNVKEHLKEEVSLSQFMQAIRDHIFAMYPIREYEINEKDMAAIEALEKSKYSTWAWNYGESPKSSIVKSGKSDAGMVEARFSLKGGCIDAIQLYGDFFASDEYAEALSALIGLEYSHASLKEKAGALAKTMAGMETDWLLRLLLE